MPQLKIAIFYDWLNQWGGAERVLLNLLNLYPQADLYTLVYDPQKTTWLPQDTKIFPSLINKLPFSKTNPIVYTPFYAAALEQFDFSQYDVVISTTSTIGHCLLTPPSTLFVCYYHNLNRHIYNSSNPLLRAYCHLDYLYARRPDAVLCNSQTVAARLKKFLSLSPQVIYPGVDTDFFVPANSSRQKYFLLVSRLVPHKNIDLAILACQKLHLPLKIIGTGRSENYLKSLSADTSEFLGNVDNSTLRRLYQSAQAVICPQLEDFGLVAVEAQACGTPVIALNLGGFTETVLNNQTGILFDKPCVDSLVAALKSFPQLHFDKKLAIQQANKFSDKNFMLHFSHTITQLWQQHHHTLS